MVPTNARITCAAERERVGERESAAVGAIRVQEEKSQRRRQQSCARSISPELDSVLSVGGVHDVRAWST